MSLKPEPSKKKLENPDKLMMMMMMVIMMMIPKQTLNCHFLYQKCKKCQGLS